MTAWLVYSVIIGAFLAVAALAAEGLLKSARRAVRAVWMVAMALTIAFTVSAPFRSAPPATIDVSQYVSVDQAPAVAVREPTRVEQLRAFGAEMLQAVMLPLDRVTVLASSASSSVNNGVRMMAVVSAIIALIVLVAVYARSMRDRVQWPFMLLLGKNVRVTPNVGPAVLGIAPPEIVVPRWVLLRNVEEQRLVLEHESEHVRANDPLLLMFACIAVACMPWNPAMWFMWSRLRLAVELDCDRRVLKRGVGKPAYGQLLVELSSSRPWMSPAIPAFSWGTSHLEQRLVAMTARPKRFRRLRRVASGAVIAAAFLAASKAEMPIPDQLQAMDASHLAQGSSDQTRRARRSDDTTRYFFRGKEITKDSAYAAMKAHTMNATLMVSPGAQVEMHLEIVPDRGFAANLGAGSSEANPLWAIPKGQYTIRNIRAYGSGVSYTVRSSTGSAPAKVDSLAATALKGFTQDTIPRKKVAPRVVVKKPVARQQVNKDTIPRVVRKVVPSDSVRRGTRKVRPGTVIDTVPVVKRVRLASDSAMIIEKIKSGRVTTDKEPVRYLYGKNLVVKDSLTGVVISADTIVMRDSIVTMSGSDTRVRIRGQSSLPTNEPLIFLNGVLFTGNLGDIDQRSIENIEVIKGAAATQLYGARAAYGVISITTKR